MGCIIQRTNWVDVKGEMDHKQQVSSSSLIKAEFIENDINNAGYFMNTLGSFWIIIQVIPEIIVIFVKVLRHNVQ